MSLFNNPFAQVATASLAIQIIVLFLLLYGFRLKRKKMFLQHARVMTSALVLHLAMIFAIMTPAFVLAIVPEFVVLHVSGIISIVALIHVPLGIAAVSLGIWLVFSWRFKGSKTCFNRKRIMLTTMAVWIAALLLGIAMYIILYWTTLAS